MRFPLMPSLLLLLACGVANLRGADGVAPPAPALNYQGRLVENGIPVSGARFFRFAILSNTSAQLWQSTEQSVTVSDGLYAIQLTGFPATILAEGGLVLRVEVGLASGSLTPLAPNIAMIPTLQATTAFSVTPGAVGTDGLVDGSVTATKIASGVISEDRLASAVQVKLNSPTVVDGSVTTVKVADAAIATSKVADNAVTTAKVTDGAVTTAKVADGAVTSVKIASGTIAEDRLDSAVVTKLNAVGGVADGGVTTAKLADGAVTTVKVADNAVTSTKISDGTVQEVDLAAAVQTKLNDSATLQAAITALTARVDKLEGQIVSGDLAGSYRVSMFQTELGGPLNENIISIYSTPGTMTLASNGTGNFVIGSEGGTTLSLVDSGTADFVRSLHPDNGSDSFPITWSYAAPVLTINEIGAFDVVAGGRLLIRSNANTSDGTNVMVLATKNP